MGRLLEQLIRLHGSEPDAGPDPGADLRPLRSQDYVTDVLEICQDEHAEWEDFEAEMDEKQRER